ncbi:hypothetical protein ACFWF3_25770 [Nocardia sp. NPDC060220]|uniref:hypothetical protein n=1 Tax=Nocardia sp. NPDC060220 TaxID=3347076 RepID=UPI0036564C0C
MTTSIANPRPGLLPTVLRVDGWSTGLFGIVMAAAAPLLRDPLGLPVPVSLLFGVVMLTGGATLLAIARGGPARFAPTVIAVNALSAVGMTALAATDIFTLTTPGIAFLLTGAALVATFAALEYVGLRRADR